MIRKSSKKHIKPVAQPKPEQVPEPVPEPVLDLSQIPVKLQEILNLKNPFEAIVNTTQLLQQYPMCADLFLRIMLSQFASLQDDKIPMAAPLFLDSLLRNKNVISFKSLYNTLLESGKEYEVWRFIPAFELSSEMIPYYKQCKLGLDTLKKILQTCPLQDKQIGGLLFDFPELSAVAYETVGNSIAPFIISVIDKLSPDQMRSLQKLTNGTGTSLDTILCQKLDTQVDLESVQEPFLLYQRYKNNENWTQATEVARFLGLDYEFLQCKSKVDGAEGLPLALLKPKLEGHEQKELIENLANNLRTSNEDQKFSDFSNVANAISAHIEEDNQQLDRAFESNRGFINQLIESNPRHEPIPEITITSKCGVCRRMLGHGQVVAYPCGHHFHKDCLDDVEYELAGKSSSIVHMPNTNEECPLCGMNSAASVHLSLIPNSFAPEFWSLKV